MNFRQDALIDDGFGEDALPLRPRITYALDMDRGHRSLLRSCLLDLALLAGALSITGIVQALLWPYDDSTLHVGQQVPADAFHAIQMRSHFGLPIAIVAYCALRFAWRRWAARAVDLDAQRQQLERCP